ncbi:hypothetical protein [Saccharothrix sp. ST-888]|uniref:hypothetical protein n=1 Tax=Saccharothrix sp. ST-888 TaxID=1427391 RepID=UPI0012E08CCE|nr:hypothetical protein [Saccharothrix sp. ST-888]
MLTATVTVNGVDVPRQFRLVDVYEPGTPGIGALDEESPVVLWLETTSTGVVGAHTVQFRMDAFLQLFTTGAEPPEWAEFVAQNSIGA